MGDVNAPDRVINRFSNNIIVYKQPASLGRDRGGGDAVGNAEGSTHPASFFFFKLATLVFYSTKSNAKAVTGVKCRMGSGTEGVWRLRECHAGVRMSPVPPLP